MSVRNAITWSLPVLMGAMAGCSLPRDCAGTLEWIRGGELRVGITTSQPWTHVDDATAAEVDGLEVELLQEFARRQDARIRWHEDSEHQLFRALDKGEIDLVIGGITADTPYAHLAGLTQPFVKLGSDQHVWAVRPGENALLLEVDRFLQVRRSDILDRVTSELVP